MSRMRSMALAFVSLLSLFACADGGGAAAGDYDNDGDVDIFQLHRGTPVSATLWRNDAASGNNFVSQNPAIQVFGLGSSVQVNELRVKWPEGQTSNHGIVAAGQTLTLNQP